MNSNVASIRKPMTPIRRPSHVMVGQDAGGHWIVSDECGLAGGIFADRAAAMHFATAECDYDPTNIYAAPDGALSLDTLFDHDWPTLKDRKLG